MNIQVNITFTSMEEMWSFFQPVNKLNDIPVKEFTVVEKEDTLMDKRIAQQHKCEVCGNNFHSDRESSKTCSKKCYMKLYLQNYKKKPKETINKQENLPPVDSESVEEPMNGKNKHGRGVKSDTFYGGLTSMP